MSLTPRAPRHVKRTSGYKIPPDLEKEMNALVESGEFVNRADQMTAALRFWLAYRKFDVKSAVSEYLNSEEGMELLEKVLRKKKIVTQSHR
jgi:Arc/MetJ-type ribon-helix-helix transcriptional regulator